MAKTSIEARTAAEGFLAVLAARGVDYLFANSGTDFPPLIEALAAFSAEGRRMPEAIAVPHENLAVAMAHGHAMVSGRPQAVMVHVNVGTANTVCGLINAARDNVPMLLAAGRTPITEAGVPGSRSRHIHWAQEMFDQSAMVREVVKWEYELRRADQVGEAVDRALAIAGSHPRGAAYLTLPREVLAAPLDGLRIAAAAPAASPPRADEAALEAAADMLAAAERPVVITAGLGRDPDAVAPLAALAERFALPVVPFMARYLCLPTGHPMHLGFAPGPLLADADLVLVIDCDVPWIPGDEGPPAEARVVHLSTDPLFARYPMRGFPCDLAITADPGAALARLDGLLRRHEAAMAQSIAARRRRLALMREELNARWAEAALQHAGAAPLHQAWVSRCVDQAKDDDTIVVNELALALDQVRFRRPGTFFGPSPAGGLGWGLGAALGAKLAAPERTVIACVGDGSYMFGNPTPAHYVSRAHDLPVLFVVFNNAGWSAVRNATQAMYPEGQAMRSNRPPLTVLEPSPAYEKVVEASGGYGERVDDPAALPGALQRSLKVVREERRQALVNVICRPR